MDLFSNLALGFATALSPESFFYCFIGVLPGLGPTAAVAMLLPITYYLSPHTSPSVFVTQPISAALLLIAAVVLGLIALPTISRRREEVFVEDD